MEGDHTMTDILRGQEMQKYTVHLLAFLRKHAGVKKMYLHMCIFKCTCVCACVGMCLCISDEYVPNTST